MYKLIFLDFVVSITIRIAPIINEANVAIIVISESTPPINNLKIKFTPSELFSSDITADKNNANKRHNQPMLVNTKECGFLVEIRCSRVAFRGVCVTDVSPCLLEWFARFCFFFEKKTNSNANGPNKKPRKLQYIVSAPLYRDIPYRSNVKKRDITKSNTGDI